MTRDQIASIVTMLADILAVLADADPADKAEIYSQLGLRLTYQPGQRIVRAEARLDQTPHWVLDSVRGGIDPIPHIALCATAPKLISTRRTGRMFSDVQTRCLPPRAAAGPESLRGQSQA